MSNLYELQRKRLKLYGEMVKNDILQRRRSQVLEKEQRKKRDNEQLQQHIENTKRFEISKRQELRDLNTSLREDNKYLSSLKQNMPISHPEDNRDFVKEIHQQDVRRLDKLKRQLSEQHKDNNTQSVSHRFIQEKQREIERLEEQRHKNRTKQMQLDSIKNYQEIKRKHQQNMNLFQVHKRLVEENEKYRSDIEGFTNVDHGILDRYQRNQYLERRAALGKNQEVIKQQMQELERRKNQEISDYKKSVGDLQHSMLKSVLVKPQRHEAKAYSMQLRNQMKQSSFRRNEQKMQKKEKIEMNNIFGGVHGRQREKMIKIIDSRLGIPDFERTKTTNSGYLDNINKTFQQHNTSRVDNPEKGQSPQRNLENTRVNSKQHGSQKPEAIVALLRGEEYRQRNMEKSNNSGSSNSRRYYKSFDPISAQNRLYAAQ